MSRCEERHLEADLGCWNEGDLMLPLRLTLKSRLGKLALTDPK
jgi:hypothetical protein